MTHPLRSPQEDRLRELLHDGDPFPVLRDFYASTGRKRQAWLKALDTFGYADLDRLARIGSSYGTAAGVELKDAVVAIFDMRRAQGRGRDPSRPRLSRRRNQRRRRR